MSDTMECPFCAEIIKVKAKKCKHCDEILVANVTQESILAEHAQNKEVMEATVAVQPAPAQPVSAPIQPVETAVSVQPASVQPVETAVPVQPTPVQPAPVQPVAQPAVEEKSDAPTIVTDDGEKAEKATTALEIMYARIAEMPESEEKQMVVEAMAKIEAEAAKGDDGDEHTLEDTIKTVVGILPDAAEIVINTAINPVSGVTTLLQKIVKRVAASQKKKSEEAEEEEEDKPVADEAAAEEVGAVDVETAVETMSELHEQLDQLPDSEAKAVVAETLEQLNDAAEEDDDGGSVIADVIGGVAGALPELVETAVDVAAQLTDD